MNMMFERRWPSRVPLKGAGSSDIAENVIAINMVL